MNTLWKLVGLAASAGVVGGSVVALRSESARPAVRTGTFTNSIEYAALGTGPRTVLFLPGGPGTPSWEKAHARSFLPSYATERYTVYWLSRRRNMPAGHSIADMADDVAQVITELGGEVYAVIGASYGGLIALHLAAQHPDRLGRVVLLGSAATIPEQAKELDRRWGEAWGHGRFTEAGEAMLAEVMLGENLPGCGACSRRSPGACSPPCSTTRRTSSSRRRRSRTTTAARCWRGSPPRC